MRKDFEWRGYRFPKGTRVLLDLYGINRDARVWAQPEEVRPERFASWDGGAFNFVTQDAASGYRCPGEPLAIVLYAC